jgi:hypothetical protein
VGAYFDLFMMKNMTRVLVAEGYNEGRTYVAGLVVPLFRFCGPDLSHFYASRAVAAGLLDYPRY